jgi:hypothetical protein
VPLTHGLSPVPSATRTRPVSNTQCHSHRTCLQYQAPRTHTCPETCSFINFNSIYEDCWHCRYSSYLCVQWYCINVQVCLWSISIRNFTRPASMVHKESRNRKMKKKIRKTAILLFYILLICYPHTRGIPFPALAPYIISGPQRSAASVTPPHKVFSVHHVITHCSTSNSTPSDILHVKYFKSWNGHTCARAMLISSRSIFLPLYE